MKRVRHAKAWAENDAEGGLSMIACNGMIVFCGATTVVPPLAIAIGEDNLAAEKITETRVDPLVTIGNYLQDGKQLFPKLTCVPYFADNANIFLSVSTDPAADRRKPAEGRGQGRGLWASQLIQHLLQIGEMNPFLFKAQVGAEAMALKGGKNNLFRWCQA